MKTRASLPVRDLTQILEDQQRGLDAWQREFRQRSARDPETEPDREAQMDARRRMAALKRTSSAVKACESRRGFTDPADAPKAPRAVVVHRNAWMRERLVKEFRELGIEVIGQGDDGAVAVAMSVVEQPEILMLEDRLPWVTPLEVVELVHRLAPHTVVAVQMEDSREASELLDAGATAVFSRAIRPDEVCECCVGALVAESEQSLQQSA